MKFQYSPLPDVREPLVKRTEVQVGLLKLLMRTGWQVVPVRLEGIAPMDQDRDPATAPSEPL